jgi:23S rRNA-/tRNA-specific pseudouridylate synthase
MSKHKPEAAASVPSPTPGQPTLLSKEGALWVIMKPAGWVVHAAEAGELYDLQAWIMAEHGVKVAPAPIHRLDRDTSGVVLFAGDAAQARAIGYHFAQGTVRKEYTALAHGHLGQAEGVIDKPLDDQRRGKRLDAVTRVERLELLPGATLVRLVPETGRKHQLRRHLHGIGHAIVGDTRYRARADEPVAHAPDRLWLHAGRLVLPDGRSFEAPLAVELAEHLAVLTGLNPKDEH